jgi:hypothetical protein
MRLEGLAAPLSFPLDSLAPRIGRAAGIREHLVPGFRLDLGPGGQDLGGDRLPVRLRIRGRAGLELAGVSILGR